MEIVNHDQAILASNLGGQTFNTEFNAMMFHTLTASLYKDKPRAVAREEIANAIDAQRERNFLFVSCYDFETDTITDQTQYDELINKGYAPPKTGWEVHIPTDIEPWMSFKDNGTGLTVEQVIGNVVYTETGTVVRNPDGSPLRKGGVYTTLFGSDKRENNRSIGAYGLGCKSPYSISDTFLVISIVGGEKHKFLMYLNSNREPMVDWLTHDNEWNPTPELVQEPNGVEVRIDGIPMRMFQKLKISISEILQTFPESEQPVINGGYYEFEPLECETIYENFKIVTKASYGTLFTNKFVVNTGGVVYPMDHTKYEEFGSLDIITNFARGKCVMLDMPLGTVAIPPSREEISYDDNTVKNIRERLEALKTFIHEEVKVYLNSLSYGNVSTLFGVSNKLKEIVGAEAAHRMIDDRFKQIKADVKSQREDLGYTYEITSEGTKVYFKVPDKIEYRFDFQCYSPHYKSDKFVTLSADRCYNINEELRLTESVNGGAIIILVDDDTKKSTLLGRINAIRTNYQCETELTADKYMIVVGSDRQNPSNIPTMESLESLASKLSAICGVDYLLSSEINDIFLTVKKELVAKNRISRDEVQRNVSVCKFDDNYPTHMGGNSNVRFVPEQFYENGDADVVAPFYYMRQEDWDKRSSLCNNVMGEKRRCEGLIEILGSDRLFVVKGIRTQSFLKFSKSEDTVLLSGEDLHDACLKTLKKEYENSFDICREIVETNNDRISTKLPVEFVKLVSPISVKNWGLRSICGAYMLQYLLGQDEHVKRLNFILTRIELSLDQDKYKIVYGETSQPVGNAPQINEIMEVLGVDIKKLSNFINISHEINSDSLMNVAGRWYHRNAKLSYANCQTTMYQSRSTSLLDILELWCSLGYTPYQEDIEMISQFMKIVSFFNLGNVLSTSHPNEISLYHVDEYTIENIGADLDKETKKVKSYIKRIFSTNTLGIDANDILRKLDLEDSVVRVVKKATPFGRYSIPSGIRERATRLNSMFKKINLLSYKLDESSFKPYVQENEE